VTAKARAKKGCDDGERGTHGLAISMVRQPRGRVKLVFDDVVRLGTVRPAQWSTKFFFTTIGFDWDDLLEVRLKDQDFLNIGFAVAARLAAQYKASRRASR
jgi:hypothetical protein